MTFDPRSCTYYNYILQISIHIRVALLAALARSANYKPYLNTLIGEMQYDLQQ